MPPTDAKVREKVFKNAVGDLVGGIAKTADAYGVSMAIRFIDGALMIPSLNLESAPADLQSFGAFAKFHVGTGVEIHFGAVVKSDIGAFCRKLKAMRASTDTRLYSKTNKHVYLCFTSGRRVYLRNKWHDEPVASPTLLARLEPAILVDEFFYAVYHDNSVQSNSMRVSPGIGSLVEEIALLAGKEHLRELVLWPNVSEITQGMRRLPTSLSLASILEGVAALRGLYTDDVIISFHSGLNYLRAKHFVILSGTSGTGKTSLARRYAAVVHGFDSLREDPLFFMCAVRPDWTDPSGLTGYFDVFADRYIAPPFLQAIIQANANSDCAVFVCLDEMNLARVEYYLSDVLSSMETGLPIRLHSSDELIRSDSGFFVPPTVEWPSNLYIVGTINVDETTHSVSDKVLDRAVVIDISGTEFSFLFDELAAESDAHAWAVAQWRDLLTILNNLLTPYNLGFGYRTVAEVIAHHAFSVSPGEIAASVSEIDRQLIQKVLAKLRGGERERELLREVSEAVKGYPAAAATMKRLARDLEDGSFQVMR